MDIRQLGKNFKGHFMTITKHRHEVMKNCFKCGIFIQGLLHDLSKYTPTEFLVGVTHYQGTRSPNEGEREDYGYSKAWMHHKGRNKHHFEYWTDYVPGKGLQPVKMPLRYLKEMFCDRVAATKVYQKDNYKPGAPLEYFLKGSAKKAMHPETAELLEKLLTMLADKGEKETFKYIKNLNNY